MRITVAHASWLLLLLASLPVMQGCDHKAKTAQVQALAPPIVDAPPPQPDTVSQANLPPPVVGTPQPPPQPQPDANAKPVPPPKKKPSHKKSPATTPDSTQPTQEAANNGSPSVSAIGELSGGASGSQRSQTVDVINATEKGVNAITRTLNESETKTAAQIREFLKQAREFLTSGDVDGATNLAKKASVLLKELNQ